MPYRCHHLAANFFVFGGFGRLSAEISKTGIQSNIKERTLITATQDYQLGNVQHKGIKDNEKEEWNNNVHGGNNPIR